MKKFVVEVEKVRGPCTRSYKEGDQFIFEGYSTPDGFCGGAYTMLFPIITTLGSGGEFSWEKDPLCKTNMACPDGGNVVFKVTLQD
jgi:uncharacterized repeat protein (TIGR04076 family)